MKSYGDFSSSSGVRMRDLQGRFTKGGWGFEWTGLESVINLPNEFGQELIDNIEENMEQLSKDIEDYAKQFAPWTDRTGNARQGLHTVNDFNSRSGKFVISLGYSVDYGFFLESYNGGEYAIVGPTMQKFAGQLGYVVTGEYDEEALSSS